jgi:hypothetical protein
MRTARRSRLLSNKVNPMRAVECAQMRIDAHGIAWVCHPKHLDVEVRTGTIPWELLEEQRLFAPQP